jgi:aspartyl-tRNA(Asn)/glutamyl-tRNA(Gln) amidotransferase subunit A
MISPWMTIRELRTLLAKGEVSVEEILTATYQYIAMYDSTVGAFLDVFDKATVRDRSAQRGILAGIPGAIKNNICIKGRRMTCASKLLEQYHAPYDATVVQKLYACGALPVGSANLDEFAMGSSCEYSALKKTCNPWDKERVPGGSSGGSLAAVAAAMVPWSLGSETGGSVRLPAAWCGVVGSKPTYGLVSRYGLTAYGSSLDQVGVTTRTVYDNALVLSAIAGQEEPVRDGTARKVPVDYDLTQKLTGELPAGLKIGIVENALHAEGVSSEVKTLLQTAIKHYEDLGAHITWISLPTMELSAATYFVISRAEAASNLARFDGVRYGTRAADVKDLAELYIRSRSEGFGEDVQRRIMIGNYVLSHGHADAFYKRACAVRHKMRQEAEQVFAQVDLLLMPVAANEAFRLSACDDNPLQMDLCDYFTSWVNLVGIPAVSVPCGFTQNNMPIGFQLLGNHWQEELLFQAAYAYEQTTSWHMQHPDLEKLK